MVSDTRNCCSLSTFAEPKEPLEDNLKQKVGQTLVALHGGFSMGPEIETLIKDYAIGTVALVSGSSANLQILDLTNALQQVASTSGHIAPLFIGVQHEGDSITPFSRSTQFTQFPCPRALATTPSATITREVGQAIGTELRALGINCNLAPVVDTNTIPENPMETSRRFGSTTDLVLNHTSAFLEGLHGSGIISVATETFCKTLQEAYSQMKTDGAIDADLSDPQEAAILSRLTAEGAIDALQLSSVTQQFNNHIAHDEAVESIIESAVRQEIGFQGPIISNTIPEEPLKLAPPCIVHEPLRALLTGCDLVYLPIDPAVQLACIRAIYCAVESNAVSPESLNRSFDRVMALKTRYLSWPGSSHESLRRSLPSLLERHVLLAKGAYRRSIQRLQDSPSPLLRLIRTSQILLLTPSLPPFAPTFIYQPNSTATIDTFTPLGMELARQKPRIRHSPYDLSSGLEPRHREFFSRIAAVVLVVVSSGKESRRAYMNFWRNVERRLAESEETRQPSQRVFRTIVGLGVENDLIGETSEELMGNGWWGVEACGWEETTQKYVAEALVGFLDR